MNAGLEGVVAAETVLSQVNGTEGRLIVRGYDIEELAGQMPFEAMAELLWRDFAPGNLDEAETAAALERGRRDAFVKVPQLLAATEGLSLVDGLRTGLSLLAEREDSHIAVTAAIPVFIAALHRASQGLAPVAPATGRAHVADFFAMLNGEPASERLVNALETYLLTVADHGMNASTFTARVVAATRAGTVASTVAALCALSGPLHGGAPGPVLDMLDEIGEFSRVDDWINQHLGDGERLMGFGHRVYRTRDPRADVLKGVVNRVQNTRGRMALAETVEKAAIEALKVRYPDRNLETNVELFTAVLLEGIGLPRDLFTPVFAMGRVLGWTAHIYEQVASSRLIRPASSYIGPLPIGAPLLAVAG
jgi:citrate synthase